MIFFWKTGPLGRLWIDESALREMVEPCLPEGTACDSVRLVGDRDLLNVYVSFNSGNAVPDPEALSAQLAEKFLPTGLKPSVSLVSGQTETLTGKNRHPLLKSPFFWGLSIGLAAAVVNLGLSGVFWVLFFGLGSFAVAWLFLTPGGRNRLASFLDSLEE